MTDHELTITSEYAMSHSGQNFTGSCSCGGWRETHGGGLGDYRARLRQYHREHISKVTG